MRILVKSHYRIVKSHVGITKRSNKILSREVSKLVGTLADKNIKSGVNSPNKDNKILFGDLAVKEGRKRLKEGTLSKGDKRMLKAANNRMAKSTLGFKLFQPGNRGKPIGIHKKRLVLLRRRLDSILQKPTK